MASSKSIIDVVLKRRIILKYICQHKPDKRNLVESVSESRPTVDRAVRELEDLNLVERRNGACEPTFTGQTAYDICEEFRDSFQILKKIKTKNSSLSPEANLHKSIFFGGSVYTPPDHAPYDKIKLVNKDLTNAKNIIAVFGVLSPYINTIIAQGEHEKSTNITLLVSNKILDEGLISLTPHIESCIQIYGGIGSPEYSLFLIDDEILYIGVHSETNHISAVIRNTNQQAIQWAKDSISELKNNGTPHTE